MNREQKAALVEELAEQIRSADAIFAVDYRGISVGDAAELRARLRDAGTRFRIVKNSLTERASDAAGQDSLKSMLEGPTALAFVAGDAALAAKALNDSARTLGTLEFKGGLMNGAPLSADDIKSIARLPGRDVLHGQLVGTIAAPLSGLVRTLNALISGLAVQLKQVADQGLVSGEAPSASEARTPSETEAEAAAPDAIASDADAAPPEPEPEVEAEAAEPAADAAPPGEPEAAEPAADTEDASASEAIASEADAEPSATEGVVASGADASAEQAEQEETDASDSEAEASKEET